MATVQITQAEATFHWVDSLLAALTFEEKIGQLFIVQLPRKNLGQRVFERAMNRVEMYGVGGFLVSRLMPPEEVYEATQHLQRASKVPLFFAADYERGVGRFNNALTELPSNMALGATRDTLLAGVAGRLTAIESRAIGVNMLFAPVVDVNNNAANPIINIRSYGEDPNLVAHMAAAFVHEAEQHGALTTFKHFPGHGNTAVDSHTRMGNIPGDHAALGRIELRPYRVVFGRPTGPSGVMSAHLWVPALDPEPLPATFSRHVLHDLLRDTLGFEGLIVTDDVKMGALNTSYSLAERTVRPLQAGANIILTPDDLAQAIAAIKAAVRAGKLEKAAIDRSVRRILEAKARAGLHKNRFSDVATLEHLLAQPHGAPIAQTIADRAVTLLKTAPVLPLRPTQHIALVQLTNYQGSESITAAMDTLAKMLDQHLGVQVRHDKAPSEAEIASLVDNVKASDVVVLALYLRLQAGRGKAGLHEAQEQLVRRLLAQEMPVVLVTFGNPYAVTDFAKADALLVAYDQVLASIRAAAGILQGRQQPRGRLPITVVPYPYDSGLTAL